MSRQFAVVSAIAIAVAALSGCGGKKSASPQATSTATQTSSSSSSSSSGSTSTGSAGSSSKPSFASRKNCAQLASLASKVTASLRPTGNATADLKREADVLDALANAAPSEIKGDFRTFASAFSSFAKAYTSSGIKPGRTPSPAQIAKFTTAVKALETPRLRAAEAHLSAWAGKNCGLSSAGP